MTDDRKTDTTIFLMPVLGIDRDKLDVHNFIDAFLDDIGRQVHHMNCIYILFHPDDMEEFQYFVESEKERGNDIVDDYDYAGGYVVVVYRFPREFLMDMELILDGRYSETSMEFKKKFLQVKKIVTDTGLRRDIPSLQWLVFKKSDDVRMSWLEDFNVEIGEDQEVWGKPNMAREILDIEQIKNKEHVQPRNI